MKRASVALFAWLLGCGAPPSPHQKQLPTPSGVAIPETSVPDAGATDASAPAQRAELPSPFATVATTRSRAHMYLLDDGNVLLVPEGIGVHGMLFASEAAGAGRNVAADGLGDQDIVTYAYGVARDDFVMCVMGGIDTPRFYTVSVKRGAVQRREGSCPIRAVTTSGARFVLRATGRPLNAQRFAFETLGAKNAAPPTLPAMAGGDFVTDVISVPDGRVYGIVAHARSAATMWQLAPGAPRPMLANDGLQDFVAGAPREPLLTVNNNGAVTYYRVQGDTLRALKLDVPVTGLTAAKDGTLFGVAEDGVRRVRLGDDDRATSDLLPLPGPRALAKQKLTCVLEPTAIVANSADDVWVLASCPEPGSDALDPRGLLLRARLTR